MSLLVSKEFYSSISESISSNLYLVVLLKLSLMGTFGSAGFRSKNALISCQLSTYFIFFVNNFLFIGKILFVLSTNIIVVVLHFPQDIGAEDCEDKHWERIPKEIFEMASSEPDKFIGNHSSPMGPSLSEIDFVLGVDLGFLG